MVVLAQAMVPSKGTAEIAKTLKIGRDKDGFLAEAHPKLRPVESVTGGIFLTGAAQGAEGHPGNRLPGQRRGGQGDRAAVASPSWSQRRPSPRCANSHCTGCEMCVDACPYRGHQPGERQGVGERGAVRRLRHLLGNLRARGHRRQERHAAADLRNDQAPGMGV